MRRLISLVSIFVAVVALALVLYNATLVDRRAPVVVEVALSAPAGDERLAQTLTAIDIRFSEPVRTSTVEARFRIEPYIAGAFVWDGPMAIFTPSAKLPPDTELTIRIEPGFEDLLGNVAELGLEPWVFRTVGPPAVVRASPADGTTGVPVDGAIDLEFDRLMDTASVEAAITVDPPATVRAAWSGEAVRLSFEPQLRFGAAYTLRLGVGAADTGGNRLRDPFTLHFSTVAAGLSVLDTVPVDGASGIGIRTPIAIRFDAPIDPASAREAFRMTPSVGGEIRIVTLEDDQRPVDGSPVGSLQPDTLLFVPDEPLAAHTTYTLTLEPTIALLNDPGTVAAGRSWAFTTGAPSSSGQNQIAFLGARSGVRNVWLMNPDGTNPRQLTVALAPVSGFDATFDGALVAFSAGGIVSVVGIDGDDEQRITEDGLYEYAPAFTPDDRWLVVGRRGADGTDHGYWLVPLPGTPGDEQRLVDHGAPPLGSAGLGGEGVGATDGTPVWMTRTAIDPAGALALVVTAADEVFLVGLARSADAMPSIRIPLAAEAAGAWSSRYGRFIVAAIGTDGGQPTSALWTVAAGGTIQAIAGTDGAVGPVGVGPDGPIAVTIRRSGEPSAGIGLLPAGAATMTRLALLPAFDDRWPAFSPAGGEILIGRTWTTRPGVGDGIWIVDLATRAARQLSADGAYARWLP